MLKTWIENIKKQRDHYECDSWKYNISGNLLELSVLPAYSKNNEKYRCAVIYIGQVIQALTCEIEKSGYQFHIQSFPSLENPSLVASIRIDKKGDSNFFSKENVYNKLPDFDNTTECITIMRNLAEWLQLKLLDSKPELFQKISGKEAPEGSNHYTLLSEYDNPFTWLKIGYWKEMIYSDCRNYLNNKQPVISDFCLHFTRKNYAVKSHDGCYIQALVLLDNQ